jgi:hypothetical protein
MDPLAAAQFQACILTSSFPGSGRGNGGHANLPPARFSWPGSLPPCASSATKSYPQPHTRRDWGFEGQLLLNGVIGRVNSAAQVDRADVRNFTDGTRPTSARTLSREPCAHFRLRRPATTDYSKAQSVSRQRPGPNRYAHAPACRYGNAQWQP